MKRSGKLLILIAILAVLALCAVLVNKATDGTEETEAETTANIIYSVDPSACEELSWTAGDTELSFRCSDGVWIYADDVAFPLDTACLDTILSGLEEVTSTKTMTDAEDLAGYGLEDPTYTLTVCTADSEMTFLFGTESTLSGELYCSIGDGNVYLVDTALRDNLYTDLYDMVQKEAVPEMETVSSVTIADDGAEWTISYLPDSGIAYSDEYVWFADAGNGFVTLDTELTETFLENLTGLTWGDCVCYDGSLAADCGMDSAAVITAVGTDSEDGEQSFILELATGSDGICYARLDGSDLIYEIDSTVYDTILYTTTNDLLPDEVLLMNWDNVQTVEVTLDGVSYRFTKETRLVETDTDESDTDESDADASDDEETEESETETVWVYNGETAELQDVLDSLDALSSSGSAYGMTPERSEEIALCFTAETEVRLAFYTYNSTSCLAVLNGESTLFVPRDEIVALCEAVNMLVLG